MPIVRAGGGGGACASPQANRRGFPSTGEASPSRSTSSKCGDRAGSWIASVCVLVRTWREGEGDCSGNRRLEGDAVIGPSGIGSGDAGDASGRLQERPGRFGSTGARHRRRSVLRRALRLPGKTRRLRVIVHPYLRSRAVSAFQPPAEPCSSLAGARSHPARLSEPPRSRAP